MLRTREDDRPLIAHYVHMKGKSKGRANQLLEKYKATMQDSGLRQVFYETQGPSRVELVQYGRYPKPIFVLYVGLEGMVRPPVNERMRERVDASRPTSNRRASCQPVKLPLGVSGVQPFVMFAACKRANR